MPPTSSSHCSSLCDPFAQPWSGFDRMGFQVCVMSTCLISSGMSMSSIFSRRHSEKMYELRDFSMTVGRVIMSALPGSRTKSTSSCRSPRNTFSRNRVCGRKAVSNTRTSSAPRKAAHRNSSWRDTTRSSLCRDRSLSDDSVPGTTGRCGNADFSLFALASTSYAALQLWVCRSNPWCCLALSLSSFMACDAMTSTARSAISTDLAPTSPMTSGLYIVTTEGNCAKMRIQEITCRTWSPVPSTILVKSSHTSRW
mmetsp:Transcript_22495/g.56414  ORF Transcript_22495/g.56414 Transcript_22495/m.56414 type:complete len:254 (+) Transcript_22495:790-1551(+)